MNEHYMPLMVIGGGEFARVVIDAAKMSGRLVRGFVDPELCEETARRFNIPRLGDDSALGNYPNDKLILGIGCVAVNDVRRRIVERINVPPSRWATIIDPTAYVSSTAKLAEGVIILAGAVVATGAVIGRHSIINLGATIDHDVEIGNFVHVAPQTAIGGGAEIGHNSYIGMAACVKDHTVVSDKTLVGMGAVVTKTFEQEATLVGVPAREQKKKGP